MKPLPLRSQYLDPQYSRAAFDLLNGLSLTSTGSKGINLYSSPGQNKSIIIPFNMLLSQQTDKVSSREKLQDLKQILELNVLELAAVLQVSRPTIYEWQNTEEIKLHSKNQERLNNLFAVSEAWKVKQAGSLGSYLHKTINQYKKSLFSLLTSEYLDLKKINQYLDDLATHLRAKQDKDRAHDALLKEHGFEPISKDDRGDRIDDIDFMD